MIGRPSTKNWRVFKKTLHLHKRSLNKTVLSWRSCCQNSQILWTKRIRLSSPCYRKQNLKVLRKHSYRIWNSSTVWWWVTARSLVSTCWWKWRGRMWLSILFFSNWRRPRACSISWSLWMRNLKFKLRNTKEETLLCKLNHLRAKKMQRR